MELLAYGSASMRSVSTDSAGRKTYRGGLRWRGSNASIPFGRLRLERDGVVGWWRVFGVESPHVSLRWEEIERAEPIRGAIPLPFNLGVRFTSGRGKMIFWTGDRDVIEEMLGACQETMPGRVHRSDRWRIVL